MYLKEYTPKRIIKLFKTLMQFNEDIYLNLITRALEMIIERINYENEQVLPENLSFSKYVPSIYSIKRLGR